MPSPYRVEIVNRSADTRHTVEVGPRRSILDAALAGGERLPYACRNGECGSCVAKLVSGTVAHPTETALTGTQRERGFILLCLAAPMSPCTVETGLAVQRSMYEPSEDT